MNWEWLKEKKKQARDFRLGQAAQNNYSVNPVGDKYYTGYGEDGQLQPDNPVAMFSTPHGNRMVHEGEGLREVPGGMEVIPQSELKRLEKSEKIPGYQAGGVMSNPVLRRATLPTPVPPVNITQPGTVAPNSRVSPVNITQPGGVAPKTRVSPVNISQPGGVAPKTRVSPINIAQPGTVAPPLQAPPVGISQPGGVAPTPATQPSPYDAAYQEALKKLQQQTEGGSPAQRARYQKYIDDLSAQEATERLVGAQEAAQQRLSGSEAYARQLEAGRTAGLTMAEAAAQAGTAQLASQEQAVRDLANFSMMGMRHTLDEKKFEEAKNQFLQTHGLDEKAMDLAWDRFKEDKQRWGQEFGLTQDQWKYKQSQDKINALISAGDFSGAGGVFNSMYGTNIDFSDVITQRNVGRWNQANEVATGIIAGDGNAEDARKRMQEMGIYDQLGFKSDSDFDKWYNTTKDANDPLIGGFKQVDSWVSKGIISQDQADKMKAYITATIDGSLSWNISDSYEVTDAAGNRIKNYETQKKANDFIAENPNAGYSIKVLKNGWITPKVIGTTVGGAGPAKIVFEDFMTNQVPDEYSDMMNQATWEKAGKPKTWEEYKQYVVKQVGDFSDKYPDANSIITFNPDNPGGKLNASRTELNKLADAISIGDTGLIEKYGLDKDIQVGQFISKASTGEVLPDGSIFLEQDPMGLVSEDIIDARGKITTFTDDSGNPRKVLVKKIAEKKTGGKTQQVSVVAYDIVNGREINITIGHKD